MAINIYVYKLCIVYNTLTYKSLYKHMTKQMLNAFEPSSLVMLTIQSLAYIYIYIPILYIFLQIYIYIYLCIYLEEPQKTKANTQAERMTEEQTEEISI